MSPEPPTADPHAGHESAWAPFRYPVFRMLWAAWLVSNLCMWMHDVAGAWMMTSLTTSPVMVALVQSAATLPVFLLGLPSGALADTVDRRRYFIVTQLWLAAVATIAAALAFAGAMTAPVLLVLMFAGGVGLAMRWPVFAAIIPELVPRARLPAALALNGIAMNVTRIVGPAVAGAVIASAGSAWVFALNAALSLAASLLILRWKRVAKPRSLPGEQMLGAMRIGMQYVGHSQRMRTVLLRVCVFFFQSTALIALLPLVAKHMHGGGAGTFTMLLATMGLGAVVGVAANPRLRRWMTLDELVRNGTLLLSAAMVVVAFAPNPWVAAPAMAAAGLGWISVSNPLMIAAQFSLPDWVRARGMSIFQVVIMAGCALGAVVWGQIAGMADVATSLTVAAVFGLVSVVLMLRFKVDGTVVEDLTPSSLWTPPSSAAPIAMHEGPVTLTIEYTIDPAQAAAFRAVMRESRRSRLRQGAASWSLLRDAATPGRYLEVVVDDSWAAHLRRFDRVTVADESLRQRRLAFHVGAEPPVVTRCIAEPMGEAD